MRPSAGAGSDDVQRPAPVQQRQRSQHRNPGSALVADPAATFDANQALVLEFSQAGTQPQDVTAYKNNPSSSTAVLTPASLIGGGAKFSAGAVLQGIERLTGLPRAAWNAPMLRALWRPLADRFDARGLSVEHEEAWLSLAGFLLRPGFDIRTMTLPDVFQEHDDPAKQYETAGLGASDIARVVANHFVRKTKARG